MIVVKRKQLLSPPYHPPTQALAVGARSQRKNGGVTIDGPEIAAVTEVIGGGGEMGETQFGSEGLWDWGLFSKTKKNPNFVLLA